MFSPGIFGDRPLFLSVPFLSFSELLSCRVLLLSSPTLFFLLLKRETPPYIPNPVLYPRFLVEGGEVTWVESKTFRKVRNSKSRLLWRRSSTSHRRGLPVSCCNDGFIYYYVIYSHLSKGNGGCGRVKHGGREGTRNNDGIKTITSLAP